MASIIVEATADADDDQFIGASVGQLQEVSNVYKGNEPDLVICAHIIDNTVKDMAAYNIYNLLFN
jgi:thiamine monophosphate synthase